MSEDKLIQRPISSSVDWQKLHVEGCNVVLPLSSGKPLHIAVIPEEVLEDGLGTMNQEPKAGAEKHRVEVDAAINRAFLRGDWKELMEVNTGSKIHQLWISRNDF